MNNVVPIQRSDTQLQMFELPVTESKNKFAGFEYPEPEGEIRVGTAVKVELTYHWWGEGALKPVPGDLLAVTLGKVFRADPDSITVVEVIAP